VNTVLAGEDLALLDDVVDVLADALAGAKLTPGQRQVVGEYRQFVQRLCLAL
jgi:hypothetical protein